MSGSLTFFCCAQKKVSKEKGVSPAVFRITRNSAGDRASMRGRVCAPRNVSYRFKKEK